MLSRTEDDSPPDRFGAVRAGLFRRSLAAGVFLQVFVGGMLLALLCTVLSFPLVRARIEAQMMEGVEAQLSALEGTIKIACFTGDKALAQEAAKGLLMNRAIASVRILDSAGTLAQESGGTSATDASSMVTRRIASPFDKDMVVGEVRLAADDDYIRSASNHAAWPVIALLLVEALALTVTFTLQVLGTVVRPIKRFSDELYRMKDPSSHIVVPPGNEHNEIGKLARDFNELLDAMNALLENERNMRRQVAHSETRFRELAENLPSVIIRYDTACCRTYFNPAYVRASGMTEQEALGVPLEQSWFVGNLGAEAYKTILQRVMLSRQQERVSLEWLSPQGERLSHEFYLVPERDARGLVQGVVAIGHDVTLLQRQQQLEVIRARVLESLAQGKALGEVLESVARYVETAHNGARCTILLLDAAGTKLYAGAMSSSMPQAYGDAIDGIAIGEGVGSCGTAAWRGERVIVEDVSTHPYWQPYLDAAALGGVLACWSEPIRDSHHKVCGVLAIYPTHMGAPDESDLVLMQQASHLAAIAIERRQIEAQMRHQASYDALTNLPNRRMLNDRLRELVAQAERMHGRMALLFIDLDRFKEVNDTLGHEAGDCLLVAAAQRIRECVRSSDIVARLGGDEFVVLLPEIAGALSIGGVAQKIVETLGHEFELGERSAYVSASVGIALYPDDARHAEALISYADQAMYVAKLGGRNAYQFHSPEMSASSERRFALLTQLRGALQRGELELYYQPKVDISSGAVIGAESLLRWNHPEFGMVPPDHFIGIAEESGLIVEIGEWVLRTACSSAVEWNQTGRACKVAVNLSSRQFRRNALVDSVRAILHETGCKPQWLELEITESLLLDDDAEIMQMLKGLHGMGLAIAIDDFGTGYSSLSYLNRFPMSQIKIDRSFVCGVPDERDKAELVKAMIYIARALNMELVAEGVETMVQADYLMAHGCCIVQGYLYGKPMRKAAFEALRCERAET